MGCLHRKLEGPWDTRETVTRRAPCANPPGYFDAEETKSMRRFMAVVLVLGLGMSAAALAAGEPEVEYVNGTVPGLKDGSTGTLDMSSAQSLAFHSGSSQFSIPYA